MMGRLSSFLFRAALLGALPLIALAGLVEPTPGEPVNTDFDSGFVAGYAEGRLVGHEDCRVDPGICAIFLSNVLPPAQYGETEPNDTMISADALSLNANFWGQSYSGSDADWYYLVTTEPNFNLTLNFSLPDANTNSLIGWNVSVRNAMGMVLAQFDSGFTTVAHAASGISYRTTLGLAGTYYIVVKPVIGSFSYQPYNLAIALVPSPNNAPNFAGGFFDAEIEPNNLPAESNWINRGVSVFGLINLRFDSAICDAESCTYAQNEDDWYVYVSPGNEIVQLGFCDRALCSAGDWFVQVFDAVTVDAIQWHGLDPDLATPLMAFNTNTQETETQTPQVWQLGLGAPGAYFMRVGHKRTLDAPCVEWTADRDNNGIPDTTRGNCACSDGTPVCDIDILNPGTPYTDTVEQVIWPVCPNGTGGGEDSFCPTACVCINESAGCTLYQTDIDGDGLPGPNAQACRCNPSGTPSCDISIQNPGSPTVIAIPDQTVYPLCPDGSGGGDSPQCSVGCICTDTSGVVEVPENVVTSQYSFTWNSSLFGSP